MAAELNWPTAARSAAPEHWAIRVTCADPRSVAFPLGAVGLPQEALGWEWGWPPRAVGRWSMDHPAASGRGPEAGRPGPPAAGRPVRARESNNRSRAEGPAS